VFPFFKKKIRKSETGKAKSTSSTRDSLRSGKNCMKFQQKYKLSWGREGGGSTAWGGLRGKDRPNGHQVTAETAWLFKKPASSPPIPEKNLQVAEVGYLKEEMENTTSTRSSKTPEALVKGRHLK